MRGTPAGAEKCEAGDGVFLTVSSSRQQLLAWAEGGRGGPSPSFFRKCASHLGLGRERGGGAHADSSVHPGLSLHEGPPFLLRAAANHAGESASEAPQQASRVKDLFNTCQRGAAPAILPASPRFATSIRGFEELV